MKRFLFCCTLILALFVLLSPRCHAAALDDLDDSLTDLRAQVSDDVSSKLDSIGVGDDLKALDGIRLEGLLSLISDELAVGLSGPLSSCAVVVGVLILASLLEGYTHSLRYTETKDIMSAVTSLMICAALITPLVGVIRTTMAVISDTASLMLLYVPIMIGILSFSGHVVQAGGCCATVMTASQAVARLSAGFIPQLLCAYLALSVACGVSGRIRLNGVCELVSRFIKWFLAFMMGLFAAVLSMQSVLARAGDTVASRAVRMTLSSLIPFIGSAVSEAYRTVQGSADLLRSGAGVFVILAVIVAFLPILMQVILWLLSVSVTRCVAEALDVSAPASLLASVASVLSVLIALIVSTMSVFIISSAALIRIGGCT